MWGEGGPVTKYSLRLPALSYSAYQASPNYNQKSYKMIFLTNPIPKYQLTTLQ